jgi:hypothetical protein
MNDLYSRLVFSRRFGISKTREGKMIRQFAVRAIAFFLIISGFSWGVVIDREGLFENSQAEVEIISNPRTPVLPPGQRKQLVFKEDLSIGQKEGDENTMFGESVNFNTDGSGCFYITDWEKRRILKYDPSGKYLLTIGRRGQGPGEFQNLSVARFDKSGQIYVTDIASRRISFFDKEGHYLSQVRIPDVFEDLYMNSKGYYVSSSSVRLESESGLSYKINYGLFNDKFELVTEFYARIPDYKPLAGRDATSMARFTAGILSEMAFQPRPRHILGSDDSIWFGYPKNYAIDVYSPEGRKIKTIKGEYEPVRITDKDKAYFAGSIARPFLSRGGLSRTEENVKEILRYVEYPPTKPAYHSFALMENGWLAVVADFAIGEYSLIDMFDENGRYIGQFKTSVPTDTWFFFKNGKAYALATDEDGYKYVKRYSFRIEDY